MSDVVEIHIKYNKQTKDLEMRCPENILTCYQVLARAQEGLLRKAMHDPRVAVGRIVLPPSVIGSN